VPCRCAPRSCVECTCADSASRRCSPNNGQSPSPAHSPLVALRARRAVGRDVRLTTGAGEVTGTVLRADGESVTVDVGGQERDIAYADLVGARMLVRL